MICFQIPIFALATTVQYELSVETSGCDLLSNSYLCVSNNSYPDLLDSFVVVVICFQIPIFALATTVISQIVFKSVCCDLLSNSYLCVSNNSVQVFPFLCLRVVICFQIPIFALATTVGTRIHLPVLKL